MRLTIALPDGQWDPPRAAVKVVDGGGGRVKLSGDEEGDGGVEGRRGEVRFRVSLTARATAERPSTTVSLTSLVAMWLSFYMN